MSRVPIVHTGLTALTVGRGASNRCRRRAIRKERGEADPDGESKETPMNVDAVPVKLSGWALILGASSGFGAATSLALARAGCHIFGVHLDRKSPLPNVGRIVAEIRAL